MSRLSLVVAVASLSNTSKQNRQTSAILSASQNPVLARAIVQNIRTTRTVERMAEELQAPLDQVTDTIAYLVKNRVFQKDIGEPVQWYPTRETRNNWFASLSVPYTLEGNLSFQDVINLLSTYRDDNLRADVSLQFGKEHPFTRAMNTIRAGVEGQYLQAVNEVLKDKPVLELTSKVVQLKLPEPSVELPVHGLQSFPISNIGDCKVMYQPLDQVPSWSPRGLDILKVQRTLDGQCNLYAKQPFSVERRDLTLAEFARVEQSTQRFMEFVAAMPGVNKNPIDYKPEWAKQMR